MTRYLRLAPGQVCERCGADNSFRKKGTKYCHQCSKELARERAAAERLYVAELKARDELPRKLERNCCKDFKWMGTYFCGVCGQRIQERVEVI